MAIKSRIARYPELEWKGQGLQVGHFSSMKILDSGRVMSVVQKYRKCASNKQLKIFRSLAVTVAMLD